MKERKLSKEEHSAFLLLKRFSKMQRTDDFVFKSICPRCGQRTMDSDVSRNALSRSLDIMICDQCGMDEAIRACSGNDIPLTKWWIAKLLEW